MEVECQAVEPQWLAAITSLAPVGPCGCRLPRGPRLFSGSALATFFLALTALAPVSTVGAVIWRNLQVFGEHGAIVSLSTQLYGVSPAYLRERCPCSSGGMAIHFVKSIPVG